MGESNEELAVADGVESSADDPGLRCREGRDAATVLAVAGVTEGEETRDTAADGGGESAGDTVGDSATLRITTANNLGLGALGGGQVVEADTLVDGSLGGSLGKSVVAESSGVWAADTLAGNVAAAEAGLQAGADIGTESGALKKMSVSSGWCMIAANSRGCRARWSHGPR